MSAIKIPFALLPPTTLYALSRHFYGVAERLTKRKRNLELNLTQSGMRITPIEYMAMCLTALAFFAALLFLASLTTLVFGAPIFVPFLITIVFSGFVFLQQMMYPTLVASRRVREVEKNLIPSLQDILIQLNAGIPLFNILVNIANGDYGEISSEFKRAVNQINAGTDQLIALEEIAVRNPSILFRRAIWQIVNGMKEGADIGSLIGEVMRAVSDEQLIQIQKYGSQLSPLALFYMLIAIIAPSLGVTFIIILSSFISLSAVTTKAIFYGLLVMTFFMQITFMGMIKTRRPTLLG